MGGSFSAIPRKHSLALTRADIERGFRVRKSDIEIGPMSHRLHEHTRAHAAICFMALILYRVMHATTGERHPPFPRALLGYAVPRSTSPDHAGCLATRRRPVHDPTGARRHLPGTHHQETHTPHSTAPLVVEQCDPQTRKINYLRGKLLNPGDQEHPLTAGDVCAVQPVEGAQAHFAGRRWMSALQRGKCPEIRPDRVKKT